MRFISMFSGIEAASVAFGPLGWEAIALSEVEPFPSAVLDHHYPNVQNVGDMTAHEWGQYRGLCDLVVGGPPCQAFSVAGLRRSLDDDRGNLSLQYVKAIHAIDPLWCITENVPGWLSTSDNAFGCFLAGLVGEDAALKPPGGRWTDAGVAAGPRRTAAWRILDAQYFGLAQRRRRVLVLSVRGAGNWACAAALFPLSNSLSGNPPPRREAGEGVTSILEAGARTGKSTTDTRAGIGISDPSDPMFTLQSGKQHAVAFGGNNQSGPIDVATALNAHGGPHGRQDFESETFIAHSLRGEGFDASEDGTGRGVPLVPVPIDMRQASRGATMTNNRPVGSSGGAPGTGIGEPGDPSPTIASSHVPAIAFDCKAGGKTSFSIGDTPGALRGDGFGGGHAAIAQAMAVRRLTPRECCRLQGFPDDYLDIVYRGKPAADGPKYKALGNSMAVPVMSWLGRRIEIVNAIADEAAA